MGSFRDFVRGLKIIFFADFKDWDIFFGRIFFYFVKRQFLGGLVLCSVLCLVLGLVWGLVLDLVWGLVLLFSFGFSYQVYSA